MGKPFKDLIIDMHDGVPYCNAGQDDCDGCAGGDAGYHPQHLDVCLLAVKRMSQVFEIARATAASQTEPMTSAMLLALETANANVGE